MLSRVASSIYWMSRYIERAENVARFIDVNLNLMLDHDSEDLRQWQPLVAASGDDEDFKKRYGEPTEKNVIHFLTFDSKNPNSILSCLAMARENARSIRDTISSEMWEHLNNFNMKVSSESRKKSHRDLHTFYTEVKNASHLFIGLSESTMSHGEGWHFARLGRLLERSDKTARILDVKYYILLPTIEEVDTPIDASVWGALLKSASAFEMYRKRFHRIYYKDVMDFLIFDEKFPRSIQYCIQRAQVSLKNIIKGMDTQPKAATELQKLVNMVAQTNAEEVSNNGLHEFVDTFQFNLNIVGNEIHKSFFSRKAILKQ